MYSKLNKNYVINISLIVMPEKKNELCFTTNLLLKGDRKFKRNENFKLMLLELFLRFYSPYFDI